jgi:hypothetical protein
MKPRATSSNTLHVHSSSSINNIFRANYDTNYLKQYEGISIFPNTTSISPSATACCMFSDLR